MSNTFDDILTRLKDGMTTEASTMEGTWSADNLQAVANELARVYSEDIDTILPQAFVVTASGINLDRACADYGVTRNEATYAEVNVTVTGFPGMYSGVRVLADDIIFVTDEFTITDVSATVRAVCLAAGSVGNVIAGTINKVESSSIGIESVTNAAAATGGYDEESDDSLRTRTLEKIREPANSGNIAHYRQWALDISGVEKVKIFPLARGNGTVDVVVIADDNTVAPQLQLDEIYEYIEEQRPIGADVRVLSATPVDLQVVATVIVKTGYTAELIQNELYTYLQEYCAGIAFTSVTLSYIRIADLFFQCEGVVDVEEYTINGSNKSIKLADREFPIAFMPTITVVEE